MLIKDNEFIKFVKYYFNIYNNNNNILYICNYNLDLNKFFYFNNNNINILIDLNNISYDNKYDIIISTECFNHDKLYKITINKIYKLLKPNGIFIFNCFVCKKINISLFNIFDIYYNSETNNLYYIAYKINNKLDNNNINNNNNNKLISYNNKKIININNYNNDISFFIIRYINNIETSDYYKYCYEKIRKYYPFNKIYIIDDNSSFFDYKKIELHNCKIIKSEYPKRGELLGYYYFHKIKPSKYAVILHDSIFFNKYIDFSNINNYKFIWDIGEKKWDDNQFILKILKKFNNDKLIDYYQEKKWLGCFGIMSIIKYDFLNDINNKIKFFDILLNEINTREKRMCLERIFGIIMSFYNNKINNKSIFGDILKYCKWELKINPIKLKYDCFMKELPLVKVWTGR